MCSDPRAQRSRLALSFHLFSLIPPSLCHLLLFSVSKYEKTPLQAYAILAGILRRLGIQCLYNTLTNHLKPALFAEISLSSVGGLLYALIKSERETKLCRTYQKGDIQHLEREFN